MIINVECGLCGNVSQIDMMTEFRYKGITFLNAITNISVKCRKCEGFFMVSLPHENIVTKEEYDTGPTS